jgi:hypothetical protein
MKDEDVSPEVIERVARAMWDTEHLQSWDGPQRPGTIITDFDRDVYRRHARAAIAALSPDNADHIAGAGKMVSDNAGDEVTEAELALREATALAVALHSQHYSHVPQWRPLNDIRGVISQIDNMVAGMKPAMRSASGEG